MKPSTSLFKLIKSLSKSEKRFFKLFSNLQAGDKKYVKLFDIFDNCDSYDEEYLNKEFKKKGLDNHLSFEKNHLFKQILKSLRLYNSENNIDSILKNEINNIEILYKKALFKECERLIIKTKKTALSYEKFYNLLDLIIWHRRLFEEDYKRNIEETFENLLNQQIEVVDLLNEYSSYHILYNQLNQYFKNAGFIRKKKEYDLLYSIKTDPLIASDVTPKSIRAKSIKYYIKGVIDISNYEYDQAILNFESNIQLLDKYELVKSDAVKRYIISIIYIIRCLIYKRDFNQAMLMVKQLKKLESNVFFQLTNIQVLIFSHSYNYEMLINNLEGNFKKSIELIPHIHKKSIDFKGRIGKELELIYFYNKAYAYFGIKEYKKSLSELNEIINDKNDFIRIDVYGFSRVLNVLVHYELMNYDLIPYLINSTYKYFRKHDVEYKTIESIFNCLKMIISNKDDSVTLFKRLEIELTEILKIQKDEIEFLEYIDIFGWIKSKF